VTVAIRTSPQILKSLQDDTLQNVRFVILIQNHFLSYFRIFNGLLIPFMSKKSSEIFAHIFRTIKRKFQSFLS